MGYQVGNCVSLLGKWSWRGNKDLSVNSLEVVVDPLIVNKFSEEQYKKKSRGLRIADERSYISRMFKRQQKMGWGRDKIQEGKSKLERAFQGGNRMPKDRDDVD